MLQNNNSSMKTVVETFIIEETQELIYDNEKLDQWNSMVAELGLTGQTKIVVKEKSPVPFLHMKTHLVSALEVLCPKKVLVQAYDKTPIPVEILSLVSLSTKEQYFDKIEIWYDDETPDPACIGYKKNSEFDPAHAYWSEVRGYDKYLIGRWADVKMSMDQLISKAKALFKLQKMNAYEQQIKSYQRQIEDLENEANNHFGFALDTSSLPF